MNDQGMRSDAYGELERITRMSRRSGGDSPGSRNNFSSRNEREREGEKGCGDEGCGERRRRIVGALREMLDAIRTSPSPSWIVQEG